MAPASEERPAGSPTIRPASVELSAAAEAARAAGTEPASRGRAGSRLAWAGVVVLALVAAAVVFILPSAVDKPLVTVATEPAAPAPSGPKAPEGAQPAAPPPQATPGITPWQAAQEAELRRQTQEVLADMLEAQKVLNQKGVEAWAPEEFRKAAEHATRGDAHYAKRDFQKASDEYKAAQGILKGLLDRIDPLFRKTMEEGTAALERGDAEKAKAAFDLALRIDALDRAAIEGRARAEKIGEVWALLREGDKMAEPERLDEAKAAYAKAAEMDAQLNAAKERLESVNARITERDFRRSMSEGFALLESDRLEEARKKFQEALRTRPGSREASVALEQVNTRIRTSGVARLLAEAQRLEDEERWAEAKEKYEAVLKLDEGMTVAREGRERAATRAGVHEQLEQILAAPDRLFDPDVFEEMSRVYRTLSALSNPGKRLSAQLAALDKALKRADTPVTVRLISDNMTSVTIYKVGELGMFTSRELSLRPGRYVAVGRREGYQDERREFFVTPDKPMEPITIQADDRIALGS